MSQKSFEEEDSLLASVNGYTMDMSAYKSNVQTVGFDWKE